jgi:hypothetical protein
VCRRPADIAANLPNLGGSVAPRDSCTSHLRTGSDDGELFARAGRLHAAHLALVAFGNSDAFAQQRIRARGVDANVRTLSGWKNFHLVREWNCRRQRDNGHDRREWKLRRARGAPVAQYNHDRSGGNLGVIATREQRSHSSESHTADFGRDALCVERRCIRFDHYR